MIEGLCYLSAGMVDWLMLSNLLIGSTPCMLPDSLLAGKIPDQGYRLPSWLWFCFPQA